MITETINQIHTNTVKIRMLRKPMRIMSYNVHACKGSDGVISPARIAEVIEDSDADIVALQELDCGRERSSRIDQAMEIAKLADMHHHFHPIIQVEEEKYGDAILSRHPMRLVKAESLPHDPRHPRAEERGALWVEVQTGAANLQIINTHFGLRHRERLLQSAAIRSIWLKKAQQKGPVVLCGDLNAPRSSLVCKRLRRKMRDSAELEARCTWPVWRPFLRLDHIFCSEEIRIESASVIKDKLSRRASDHYPLIAEIDTRVSDQSIEAYPTI